MPHSHDIREFRITRRGIEVGEDQPQMSDLAPARRAPKPAASQAGRRARR